MNVPTGEDILRLTNVEAGYGDYIVLRDVSLAVERGELVAVIGPNGAGKSTLLKTIISLLRARSGNISFRNEDITNASSREIVRRGVSYVPQGAGTFPQMTVYENIEAGAYVMNDNKIISARMAKSLELFPRLQERLYQRAYTLSGGERQMLLLARALMMDPQLILLDEPSLGLDPKMQITLYDTLNRIHNLGKAILLVEQNIHAALAISDRCYILEVGRITHEGTPAELNSTQEIKRAYLGM